MTIFNWLHLTDFHRGLKEHSWAWPSVKQMFFEDLERLHDKCGPWDLVIFTGDLTQQGSNDEFQNTNEILDEIWDHFLCLGSKPKLLAVPGNHDLVRPIKKSDPLLLLLRMWDQQKTVRDDFWNNPDSPYRQVIIKAFENYVAWQQNQSYIPSNLKHGFLPGDFSFTFEKEGLSLGILGLNTAFLQLTGDDYEGKIALHTHQFHHACDGEGPRWVKQHNSCIIMTHHPPAWLNPESLEHLNEEITCHGHFAVQLCGHLHETRSFSISEAGTEAKRIFQGKSLFGFEVYGFKQNRLHGYSAGRIEILDNRGELLFWPRELRLQGTQRKIVPDFSLNLTDDQHTIPIVFKQISANSVSVKGRERLYRESITEPATEIKIIHNLPQPEYERFIGREKELEQIKNLLSPKSRHFVITIDGVGGIGKSALALETAYRYLHYGSDLPESERFKAIIWTTAKQDMMSGDGIKPRNGSLNTLEDIYSTLIFYHKGDVDESVSREELVRAALTRQRTLLIVDNFETIDDERVMNFIREVPEPTKVIVTTRHRIDVAYPIRLYGMSESESREIIKEECRRKKVGLSNYETELIFLRTGGVPLAIVWSVAQMSFGNNVEVVLNRLGEPNNDIAEFCFEEALRFIKEKPSYNILMALSFFTEVNREMIGKITDLPILDRDDGLVELEKLSLINVKEGWFSLLPLTRNFAITELAKNRELKYHLESRFNEYFEPLPYAIPDGIIRPGGPIDTTSAFYIQRKADEMVLSEVARQRCMVMVRAPRQTGKTSLILRVYEACKRGEIPVRPVFFDFQSIHLESMDTVWHAIVESMNDQLFIGASQEEIWQIEGNIVRKLSAFLDNHVFRESETGVLLCLDEVDRIIGHPISNQFFANIRAFYNMGAFEPIWKKIGWLLSSSTEPSFFIEDLTQSPFNIGQTIYLKPFTIEEILEFSRRFGLSLDEASVERIFTYVGGHPHLVHLLLYNMARSTDSWERFFDARTAGDGIFRNHLDRFLAYLQEDAELSKALKDIIKGRGCRSLKIVERLKASGLVKQQNDGRVFFQCELYALFFGREL